MSSSCKIGTIVVLDLETNNLPCYQFNKCGITELCMYAFSSKYLEGSRKEFLLNNNKRPVTAEITTTTTMTDEKRGQLTIADMKPKIPELPRVLHKLTLMINPRRLIAVQAEKVTGLNNEMLCQEQHFDENTGELLMKFLKRLQQPICIVAHNGLQFDFPIIRYVLDNINMKMDSSILCVDSYKAFAAIDHMIENICEQQQTTLINKDHNDSDAEADTKSILNANDSINWQVLNETTPQRPSKREKVSNNTSGPTKSTDIKAKRSLFDQNKIPRAPKGFYVLGSIYERIFQQQFPNLHRAENDVIILSKLLLHYGHDFLEYATNNAISFDQVKRLGSYS